MVFKTVKNQKQWSFYWRKCKQLFEPLQIKIFIHPLNFLPREHNAIVGPILNILGDFAAYRNTLIGETFAKVYLVKNF